MLSFDLVLRGVFSCTWGGGGGGGGNTNKQKGAWEYVCFFFTSETGGLEFRLGWFLAHIWV